MSAQNLLFILPLISLLAVPVCGWLLRHKNREAGYFSIFLSSLSLGAALYLFFLPDTEVPFSWFQIGNTSFQLSLLKDNISASMAVLVTLVNLLVQVFSTGYMKGDRRYAMYFAWLGLFTASMLGIVLSGSLLLTFLCWELVGLSSYLLISFWYEKPKPGPAARKAFLLNRVADVGFLSGMLILWARYQTFSLHELNSLAPFSDTWTILAGLLLLIGAFGKSAQFPFQAWLPDAMAGPTPASAMIHAATMVAAGVYFAARIFPMLGPDALLMAGISGGITAVFAAAAALAQTDLKKILAYSTLSQLGLMMLGISAAAPEQAMFHLFTHAIFKCGLFLSAAAILDYRHHLLHSDNDAEIQDIRNMEGLQKNIPLVALCFLIFSLALSGIPLFSGFLSKEGILYALWNQAGNSPLHLSLLIASFLTSFLTPLYMFGIIFRIFRGNSTEKKTSLYTVYSVPLIILSVFSLGWAFSPVQPWSAEDSWFLHSVYPGQESTHSIWVPMISISLSLAGISLAWYRRNAEIFSFVMLKYHFGLDLLWEVVVRRSLQFLSQASDFNDRRVVDAAVNLSADIVAGPAAEKPGISLSRLAKWTDRFAIDTLVQGTALSFWSSGWVFRTLQNGKAQSYLALTFLLLLVLIFVLLIH